MVNLSHCSLWTVTVLVIIIIILDTFDLITPQSLQYVWPNWLLDMLDPCFEQFIAHFLELYLLYVLYGGHFGRATKNHYFAYNFWSKIARDLLFGSNDRHFGALQVTCLQLSRGCSPWGSKLTKSIFCYFRSVIAHYLWVGEKCCFFMKCAALHKQSKTEISLLISIVLLKLWPKNCQNVPWVPNHTFANISSSMTPRDL